MENQEEKDFETIISGGGNIQNEVVSLEQKLNALKSRLPQNKKSSNFLLPISIIIAGLVIGGAVIYSKRMPSPAPTGNNNQQAGAQVNIKDVRIAGEPFIGSQNAPVTMAYWRDYQCPFCQRFETDTLPSIFDQYVKTGKLKIVFKDFQFLGPDSDTAGLAGRAVWELYPDKFFDWQQTMFQKQGAENSGWATKNKILVITATVSGIDANAVGRLMDQKKAEYEQKIVADRDEGQKFGINGTPGFVIGKQSLFGAQPLAQFQQIIDAELKK